MRDGWQRVQLGDIAEIVGGSTPSTSNPGFWGGAIPWITPSEVTRQEGQTIYSTDRTLTEAGHGSMRGRLLPVNTVLLTSRATVGATALTGVPMAVNQGFAALVAGPRVDPRWLLIWCQLNRPAFEALAGGSTFPEISKPKVRSVWVDLPPRVEQRRIVDLVRAVDSAAGAARTQTRAARELYKRAASEAFDHSDEGLRELGSVVEVRIGRQRAPKYADGRNMLRYLRAANVKDGKLDLTSVLKMQFDPAEAKVYGLANGDVLVTEGCGSLSQLGASARWDGTLPGDVCFQNTLLRLRALPGVSSPDYVHHLARHAYAAGWWASIASGTNIFHIGAGRAERILVPVPDLERQTSLAAALNAVDAAARAADSEAEAFDMVRGSVLRELLGGQRILADSYDRFLDGAA